MGVKSHPPKSRADVTARMIAILFIPYLICFVPTIAFARTGVAFLRCKPHPWDDPRLPGTTVQCSDCTK